MAVLKSTPLYCQLSWHRGAEAVPPSPRVPAIKSDILFILGEELKNGKTESTEPAIIEIRRGVKTGEEDQKKGMRFSSAMYDPSAC